MTKTPPIWPDMLDASSRRQLFIYTSYQRQKNKNRGLSILPGAAGVTEVVGGKAGFSKHISVAEMKSQHDCAGCRTIQAL